jgi:uncharacterized protein (DUF362 family)
MREIMEKLIERFEALRKKRMSRRNFFKACLALAGLFFLGREALKSASAQKPAKTTVNARRKKGARGKHDLVVASDENPFNLVIKAMEAMGGMSRFVDRGDVVVIKPNIGWDRTPEQAGNTNPQVVAALVKLALQAGAKKVKVFDIPCNDARRCYENSGIRRAAEENGAAVFFPDHWNILPAHFSYESLMEGWPILREALECDTFINVPILKHHSLTRLTLSMKNLMGVCVGSRGNIHQDIGRKLVDLTDFIQPDLTVIDAFRVLVRNGPTGGDLADVENLRTVIISHDSTLADLYACQLMGVDPQEVSCLQQALERKFGLTDLQKADILDLRKAI